MTLSAMRSAKCSGLSEGAAVSGAFRANRCVCAEDWYACTQ